MGLELIIIGTVIALSAAASAYAIWSAPKTKQDTMSPSSLDAFNVTHAQEGLAIPLIYGRVRIPGNIIWWGDLRTKALKQNRGGKGGGGGSATTGYQYFISIWQAISMGEIALLGTYINDKKQDISAIDTIFNNGTQNNFPGNIAQANKLPGVAHIYYDNWYIGDNVTTVPTVHFIVERILDTIIDNANLATGSNPAAVIYDLLTQGGVPNSEIDLISFNAAAAFWATQPGLNLVLDQQISISEAIEAVLQYVDAIVYVSNLGLYAIKVFDPNETYKELITQDELDDFSLNRKTWGQIPNDFHATLVDESKDFTRRVVIAQNPAAILMAGQRILQSIDLKCFRDLESASRRLFEIMKRSSYPISEIKFKTNLKHSTLLPGDVIRIQYPDWGIVSANFRVLTIDTNNITQNEIQIQAAQQIETLFDDIYNISGGTIWESPNNLVPIPLTKIRILELPYNSQTLSAPAFLILAAREFLNETSYQVLVSTQSDQDFSVVAESLTFSQCGFLDTDYLDSTRKIDDIVGIAFSPYKNDPIFDTINRTRLFLENRLAVIDDEILAFQQVIPLGPGRYRLLGCIRGILGTAIQNHTMGSQIWLTQIGDNIISDIKIIDFYMKIVPWLLNNSADASLISAISIATRYVAKRPRNPARIIAIRQGGKINISIWPSSPGINGAGETWPNEPGTGTPFHFLGDFQISWGPNIQYIATCDFYIIQPGATIITIRSRINGYLSSGKSIAIGAANGTYKS